MFGRSHGSRSSNNGQGFGNDREHKPPSLHRSLLAGLGFGGSGSSTARSGSGLLRRTDSGRPSNDYASSLASARTYAATPSPSHLERSHSISSGTLGGTPSSHRGTTPSLLSSDTTLRDNYSRAASATPTPSLTRMNSERSRPRRERTFVGSECAVCEEPLEHTLRGEKILQFSCAHVSHEACFYEYIREFDSQYCPTCNAPLHLDTSRGGNVLDIEKISNMVRANDSRSQATPTPTPSHWDDPQGRPHSRGSGARGGSAGHGGPREPANHNNNNNNLNSSHHSSNHSHTKGSLRGSRDSREAPSSEHQYQGQRHARTDSEATGVASSGGYPETTQSGPPRRHDYDVQAMETSLSSPRSVTRNPIPAPTVTVRSEFPTINRSRQQQTLTCLVTIEVPDNKWRPDPEDLQNAPPLTPATSRGPGEEMMRSPSPARSAPRFYPYESPEVLIEMTDNLRSRVDNWHGLDFSRFGKLRLYGTLRVGKDKVSWQELECFLFAEMLICVKEKKQAPQLVQPTWGEEAAPRKLPRCTLKGSILIKKHLHEVLETGNIDENVLTLSLSVAELPQFHLRFENRNQLKLWQQALLDLNAVETSPVRSPDYDRGDFSEAEEDEWNRASGAGSGSGSGSGVSGASGRPQRVSSLASSSWGGPKSATTAPTEYTPTHSHSHSHTHSNTARSQTGGPGASIHVPVDVVVVVPISASMQGVKINLVRDALRFMVQALGERDRMGLVTFGSSGGGVPIVGMTTKAWAGWGNVLNAIKPVGQKSHRADVVEGANVAMDLLMGRKYNNPIATIMLISDASTSDADSVDFVVSRAEAAKITIHSFGLGMTHKPDTMIELSTRTKASYTYVKDWMNLRECLAGCLGAGQTLSHQNVKLKLRLPEGSPAKFHKISGALQITKRATGREAEASLGDLRFGDKRDILVQLVVLPDTSSQEQLPQDPWDNIVSGLEALGGGAMDQDEQRAVSVEEVPLIQAEISWGDVLRGDGSVQHTRPSLLAITMLPAVNPRKTWGNSNAPPIPPHPHIVQRRMELLTSDMLTRALTLVSRGQHDRAHTLLAETRSILKGLGKGGLPPVPPTPTTATSTNTLKSQPSTPHPGSDRDGTSPNRLGTPDRKNTPSPTSAHLAASNALGGNNHNSAIPNPLLPRSRSNDGLTIGTTTSAGIDATTVAALDAELESSLEWISHPAVFGRDSRKAVLQAIGVISSQRAFTFRTPVEALWAGRVGGVRRLTEKSREWREEGGGEGGIMEEA